MEPAGQWDCLEQCFYATGTFSANGDGVFVWEHAGFLRQLTRHVLANPLETGRATLQHDISVHILSDVHVTLHEAAERSVVDSVGYINIENCPGQYFRVTEV